MIVHLDTCGCVLAIGPDGEPNAFEGQPCERHVGAEVAEVVAQCRAKNAAVAASGRTPDELVWGFAESGAAHVGTLDMLSGQFDAVSSSPPLSLEAFVAAVASASGS
jgi:hypothetical protein